MKIIRLSDTINTLLAQAAVFPFHQTGERQADGWWLVPIEDEAADTIDFHRLAGETDDDVVQRLLLTGPSRRWN